MSKPRILRSIVLACTAMLWALPASAGEPRAVLELFTSQGCSSCPPADRLLGELANDKSLIAVSVPIDYWDYLGWKDTLATPGHSARQRDYARKRGDRQVYTPQMVVNGVVHALGSDKAAIERAITQSKSNADTLSLPVTVARADGKITVSVPAWKNGAAQGEIWLCPVSKSVPVVIGRGENRGRTVTYHNVVRKWIKLGDWTGAAGTWSLPVKDIEGEFDSVAIMVQRGEVGSPGALVGANTVALR